MNEQTKLTPAQMRGHEWLVHVTHAKQDAARWRALAERAAEGIAHLVYKNHPGECDACYDASQVLAEILEAGK